VSVQTAQMNLRRAIGLAAFAVSVVLAIFCSAACRNAASDSATASHKAAPDSESPTDRVTFVQWTDPHLFDAGLNRSGDGVYEEAIDNRAGLHWAVLETNRLALAEHRKIDFVVITGDFGIENVQLQEVQGTQSRKCDCPRRLVGHSGPIEPVPFDQAVSEVARELNALVVKHVYVVPGDQDLCQEDPRDLHRWAEFVFGVQSELEKQRIARLKSLDASYPHGGKRIAPPDPPKLIDLTFSLNRLYEQKDSRIMALFAGDVKPDEVPDLPPSEHGFYLLGVNTAYFAPHQNAPNDLQQAVDHAIKQELLFVEKHIVRGNSNLLFMHIPDIDEPNATSVVSTNSTKSVPDKGSSWKLPGGDDLQLVDDDPPTPSRAKLTANVLNLREFWQKDILERTDVIGVFAGHFHSPPREVYPHNFTFGQKPNSIAAAKFWLAPPLAITNQWVLPPEKVARGMLLVTVTGANAIRVSGEDRETVQPSAIWFSTLDQKTATDGDDKLMEARAAAIDGNWDAAVSSYEQALNSSDPRARATAARGYTHARSVTRTWWWEIGAYFPPVHWVFIHPVRMALALPFVLLVLVLIKLLRQFRLFALLGAVIKFLVIPRFRGRAIMNAPVAITQGAPATEFGALIQSATEEIRMSLLREQENWAARQISFLSPSTSSLDQVVSSIPDIQKLGVADWLKFLIKLTQAFRWSVDCGLAVIDGGAPTPALPPGGMDSAQLPATGQLSAYAVLQWSFFVKNSWRRTIRIEDASSKAALARTLAELILGEAFARRRLS